MDSEPLFNHPPLADAARLAELVAGCGVPDLVHWKVSGLCDARGRGASATLEDWIHDPGLDVAERAEVEWAVQRLGAALTRARAEESAFAARLQRLEPTGDPRLDALRQALAAQRLPGLHPWPAGLFLPRVRASAEGEALVLSLDFDPGAALIPPPSGRRGRRFNRAEVTLPALHRWTQAPQLLCSCGSPACVHRALALDTLLERTARADAFTARVQALLQPAWRRALFELWEDPPARRDDGPVTLSVVVGDYTDLAWHRVDARGRTGAGRPFGSHDSPPLERFTGRDRRLAELWLLWRKDRAAPHHSDGPDYPFGDDGPFGEAFPVPERFAPLSGEGRFAPLFGDFLLALAGHPEVRLHPYGHPVPVRVGAAHVVVARDEGALALRVFAGDLEVTGPCDYRCSQGHLLVRRRADALELYVVAPEVARLAEALRRTGRPRFPAEALGELLQQLPRLEAAARVELPEDLRGVEEPPSDRVLVQVGGEFPEVRIRTEPLPGGAAFVPGAGAPMSAAFDGARRRFTRRDLEGELVRARAVAEALGLRPEDKEGFCWPVGFGDAGVELLQRLAGLSLTGVTVEWERQPPRFCRSAGLGALSLQVKREREWFAVDGALEVDGGRITLAQLLEAARLREKWVRVEPDAYVELSAALLERLAGLARVRHDEGLPRVGPGLAPLLKSLAPEVKALEDDAEWAALTQRLGAAQQREVQVPAALAPVLRDYQREGFAWMSRLAEWAPGACLADDMGLGKTLQALALLVSRQEDGPALVVAPSSVLHGWKKEAERFAPSLRVRLFHQSDRLLDFLGPGDVVVVSWSMLAREAKLFASARFATAVLDEAQAIKSSGTQRARAAQRLQAGFVLALTGTPVENHLGELWSLCQVVMPGLLGTEHQFNARFDGNDPEAVRALSQVIRPFVLRRTRAAVARELPPRTALEVVVPLSPDERALYDDVRLAAAAKLGEVTGEHQRLEVLAVLTRLRLAACHPKLVDARWRGEASKLARLLELVKELSQAGHRALVFSQFTQHLALVAAALEREDIAFSSLDGQVPPEERQRRVDEFQAGEGGAVFLLSPRAGDAELTLTAADYVIHLDPGWIPSVEDQACDRAHRIGHEKPVTVYRLVAEGTVEEQILALHRDKRELVDALLEGADQAGRWSAVELAEWVLRGR